MRPIPQSLSGWPRPRLRDLIEHEVRGEIAAYRERQEGAGEWIWLSLEELEAALTKGGASFGNRDDTPPDIDEALAERAALEAFADRLVLVFVDGVAILDLDAKLDLTPASTVRYIKLSSQRGG